jgi:hypothetical protein
MTPAIGRIVHVCFPAGYLPRDQRYLPAIITSVITDTQVEVEIFYAPLQNLAAPIMKDGTALGEGTLTYSEDPVAGTWRWPPRVG